MFSILPNLFNKFFPEVAKGATRRREAALAKKVVRRRQAGLVRPRLEELEGRIVLSTYDYIGAAGGAWTDGNNWQNADTLTVGQTPGSTDVAVIPAGTSAVLNGSTPQTVAGLTLGGGLTINSGQLSVTSATLASGSAFALNPGAKLDIMSSADFNGTAAINGRIDANTSSVNFNSGSAVTLGVGTNLTGSGSFNVNAPVTVSAPISQSATMTLNNNGSSTTGSLTGGGSIADAGEFDWNGGTIGLSSGVSIEATAKFKMQGSDTKYLTAGTISNNCLHTDLGGTGTLFFMGGAFDNQTGSVDLSAPTLSQGSGVKIGFTNESPASVDVTSACTIGCCFTNLGTLQLEVGAPLTLLGGTSGSVINLDGHLQLADTLTVSGTVASPTGFTENTGTGAVKVTGTLTVGSGATGLIQNTLEVTGTGTLNGAGEIDNEGRLLLDVGSTTGFGSYSQSNSGTLELQTGGPGMSSALAVGGPAQLSGTLQLDFLGGYTPSSGMAFPALTATSIGAHFDQTPPNMTATYTSTSVSVTEN